MIVIAGRPVHPSMLRSEWAFNAEQQEIIRRMAASPEMFAYPSVDQLLFELKLRDHLIKSSRALYMSGLAFSTFEHSRCNPEFWIRTEQGGFQLRDEVRPSEGIIDIFRNGRMYATECATAMVIILYHAVLHSIRRDDFEQLFANLLLYDWRYDKDLQLSTIPTNTFLPGDILYFDNPDHNPLTPQWQGENAVYLGAGLYYGHGAGIRPAPSMISFLNEQRKPGAARSAYLVSQATRPGFSYLSRFNDNGNGGLIRGQITQMSSRIIAEIGLLYEEC